jgi:hypothetical protein
MIPLNGKSIKYLPGSRPVVGRPKIDKKTDSDPELRKSKSQIASGILIKLRTEPRN